MACFLFEKLEAKAADPFIATGASYGGSSQIRIFDLKGGLLTSFFSFSKNFFGGVNLACGDVDGDKKQEIVVAQKTGGSQIRIFSEDGKLKYSPFEAFNRNFYGGVDIALGDLDLDDKAEIIAGAGKGGGSQIKIFDFLGKEKSNFVAFSKNFHGGVSLAAGDIDRDGVLEIIVGAGQGGESLIRIFEANSELKNIQYSPFASYFRGGAEVASGDIDGDGKDEIGVCQQAYGARCKIYRYNEDKSIVSEWEAYSFPSGARISMTDIDFNGKVEIITSALSFGSRIRIFQSDGKPLPINFFAYSKFAGGADAKILLDSKKDSARVIYVDDGDTIFLSDGREVRYIGIDTPEVGKYYYLEATNKNRELVLGKEVAVEYDQQKIDPYGRHLAYISVGGDLVNLKLVEEGYARAKIFFPDKKYSKIFVEAEKKAQTKKIGIWQKASNEKSRNILFSFWDKFNKIFGN